MNLFRKLRHRLALWRMNRRFPGAAQGPTPF